MRVGGRPTSQSFSRGHCWLGTWSDDQRRRSSFVRPSVCLSVRPSIRPQCPVRPSRVQFVYSRRRRQTYDNAPSTVICPPLSLPTPSLDHVQVKMFLITATGVQSTTNFASPARFIDVR